MSPVTLGFLRQHWGTAYAARDGACTATPRQPGNGTLTAATPAALLRLIRADYRPPQSDLMST
ncbi:MAG TPA: hypothetical protein VMV92_09170 [Streptosporangiaceae bacterium]|nr:hypothetical protein [Streptosporangiaceae bacterium]HVB45310.1 hypothetical protein [Streptosporangiaceae bacterium]